VSAGSQRIKISGSINHKLYMSRLLKRFAIAIFSIITTTAIAQDKTLIQVNYAKETGDMKPVWAWFGYDEPNYTYMKDGKKLLS
jgi:xylan 1,4-beta-xylosidase